MWPHERSLVKQLAGKPFTFSLAAALKQGPVVLYFYPAAFTPGCTVEAHEFAEATDKFKAMGATVIGVSHDPILANCWFWLAQYDSHPSIPRNWNQWTMWQYTNGKSGNQPYEMPGIGICDRNLFAGDEAALRAFWSGTPIQTS